MEMLLRIKRLLSRISGKAPSGRGGDPYDQPRHLRVGKLGEHAARKHLRKQGLKFLVSNFRTPRGEIDLVMRDQDCLVFIEVKARTSEDWGRPAAAVDRERRGRLTRAALDYLRKIRNPQLMIRFDIVEVLLEGEKIQEVRHLPNAFEMQKPHRYG